MNSSRAIVVNGLSRGGTNILWNILQSHPHVCSPIYETGELIFDHIPPFTLFDPSTAKRIAAWPIVSWLVRSYLRRQFEKWKLQNLQSSDNNTKYEGVLYQREEIEARRHLRRRIEPPSLDMNDVGGVAIFVSFVAEAKVECVRSFANGVQQHMPKQYRTG